MTQYISKAAVVAEIEGRLKKYKEEIGKYSPFQHSLVYDIIGKKEECKDILSFLDTLEVKEVDLEDDVDKILEANDWNFDKIDFYQFAKHFFELGLKARKGE